MFLYLLSDVVIERPNQVWSTNITYIPMRHVFLVAVMDGFSRVVLSWEQSSGTLISASGSAHHR